MQLEIGKIYDGKVTGITKFGAFVELEPGTTGMVHISEVAYDFVNDISEHLREGQEVKVKYLAVNEQGKISLSIKKALPPAPKPEFKKNNFKPNPNNQNFDRNRTRPNNNNFAKPPKEVAPVTAETAFEDMLNKFKHNSEERMGDIKKNVDNKRRSQSRRK